MLTEGGAGVGQASREETAGRVPVVGVARNAMGIGGILVVGMRAAGPTWVGKRRPMTDGGSGRPEAVVPLPSMDGG
jgi:hypothetical protein